MSRSLHALFIEDSEDDMILLARTLRRSGYDLTFERVQTLDAIQAALTTDTWDVIIADYTLPDINALDALSVVQKRELDVPFIIVSASIGEETAVTAMKAGAHDYVMKRNLARLPPVIERELRESQVRQARKETEQELRQERDLTTTILSTTGALVVVLKPDGTLVRFNRTCEQLTGYTLTDMQGQTIWDILVPSEQRKGVEATFGSLALGYSPVRYENDWLTRDGRRRRIVWECTVLLDEQNHVEYIIGTGLDITERMHAEEQLQRSNEALTLAYDATIEGWARALELRDAETEGHSRRVTDLTLRLARAMHISGEALLQIRRGAILHDIGKMSIPDNILLKAGPLSETEWDIMRQHPLYAYQMLAPISFLQPALDIPLYHHEKWDGTGYPYGLNGEEIPLAARIFAVIDVWDALRSDRPYRKGWSKQEVCHFIRDQAGKHFDPQVAHLFLQLVQDDTCLAAPPPHIQQQDNLVPFSIHRSDRACYTM